MLQRHEKFIIRPRLSEGNPQLLKYFNDLGYLFLYYAVSY
jgi:hypothetical protein